MDSRQKERFTEWSSATVDAIRERAKTMRVQAPNLPTVAVMLDQAAKLVDDAWEIVDEEQW